MRIRTAREDDDKWTESVRVTLVRVPLETTGARERERERRPRRLEQRGGARKKKETEEESDEQVGKYRGRRKEQSERKEF